MTTHEGSDLRLVKRPEKNYESPHLEKDGVVSIESCFRPICSDVVCNQMLELRENEV